MSEGQIKVYDRRLSNREIADVLQLSPERDMLVEEQNLLKQCLSAMPVGYIPNHTAENLPEMIGDLAKALAEETTERENLEREMRWLRTVLRDMRGCNFSLVDTGRGLGEQAIAHKALAELKGAEP